MLRNYLKIVIRNIVRHKSYTILNVSGLAIGIAVSTLIMLFVKYEWEYDRFYPNTDSIYRMIQRQPGNVFMGTDYFGVTQEPLGRTLKSEFPEVNNYVTMSNWRNVVLEINDEQNFEENVLYATTPNLLQMFSFTMIKGDPANPLSQPNTIILSEEIAKKFFGDQNAVGKTITARGDDTWTVTGIFKSMPANSQFASYGIITSFETYALTLKNRERSFQWDNSSWYTYLQLNEGTDPNSLQAKFPTIEKKYMTSLDGTTKDNPFFLQPLKDIHLFNEVNFNMGEKGDIKIVMVLIAIAFIILLIACINYINLFTARASLRAKEVGVRKVIGAKKRQLVLQFIGDSITLSVIAGVLAHIIDELFLPSFNNIIGINLGASVLFEPYFMIGFAIITLLVGLLSGAYPALILSNFHPIRVLKGNGQRGEHSSIRRVLVVAQFSASIALIACTFVVLSQMNYIKTKDLGYNRDNVIVLPINDPSISRNIEPVKDELSRYPDILNITASSHLPINISSETSVHMLGESDKIDTQSYQLQTDYNFINTFDIKLAEGRNFSRSVPTDSSNAIIINQSLAKSLGLESALGKVITIHDSKYNIIGVIKDFNMHSLHHDIFPLFIGLSNSRRQFLSIRVTSNELPETINYIKSVWNKFSLQRPFKYTFLDSDFNKLYKSDRRLAQIVTYSSGLAIFIACLGLLGLVSFIVEQRRKEIGIRKVLGASVSDVLVTLSKQFIRLVLLANVIAWPIAFYLLQKWLSEFAFRIDISLWMFALSGGIALIIAVATISYQAVKAARANPVESLKYE